MSDTGNDKGPGALRLAERLANSLAYRVGSFADARRERQSLRRYLERGRPPLTAGYHLHKWETITAALKHPPTLEAFARGLPLPQGYGAGLDERVVEYPWLFARLARAGRGPLLDAGSVLNFPEIITQPSLEGRQVHIATLAPEANCFWRRGVSYLYVDLRDLPVRDEFYETVVCVSTLEHVGLDNELYTGKGEAHLSPGDHLVAARELWRVLRPGGRLYLTLPFGKRTPLRWLQQFDSRMVGLILEQLAPSESSVTFYKYAGGAWALSSEAECADCVYTDAAVWNTTAEGGGAANPAADTPVAAGAVVCLDLLKGR